MLGNRQPIKIEQGYVTSVTGNARRVNSNQKLLLKCQLWSEKSVKDKLDGTVRNNRVFKELTEKLAEAGYQQTPGQLRDKLKKAKKDYKAVKDKASNCQTYHTG